jgi:hypothetical protein
LYVVATAVIAVLMAVDDPRDLLGALLTLVSGSVIWVFFERGGRRPVQ